MLKKSFKILIIIIFSLFQISFINILFFPFNLLNLILGFMIFISLINYIDGLYFLIISSLILELYSPYSFGFLFFVYCATFLIIVWLSLNFLTNKSLYSFFVIALIGILIYNLIFYMANNILFFINSSDFFITFDSYFVSRFGYKVFINLFFLTGAFLFYKLASRKMKTVFLVK
ncbi:MAG: hypothetical protein V1891_00085 [bacterium]